MSQPAPQPRLLPRQRLQERVVSAMLDAAAAVFTERGGAASMADVAAAAGVARATVYRYFPNRGALVAALVERTLETAGARLAAARIDEVPAREAITRAVRVLVELGDAFVVVARERSAGGDDGVRARVVLPLRGVVERGQQAGALRGDIPAAWLAEALVGLAASLLSSSASLGKEDTVSAVAALFLEGAGRAQDPATVTRLEAQ